MKKSYSLFYALLFIGVVFHILLALYCSINLGDFVNRFFKAVLVTAIISTPTITQA
ncbi:MipA/OmpV family protein, partial [Salmonella enterica subsp. enterica]|nr:MipA/OmpV family protein [Salmonella enterica subsp. enterica]